MNSDIETTDSSRYTPTCSLTPGWSRTIWPAETPRIAIWLWPGPRFCTEKPATLAETSSMVSAPRVRRARPDGATTEKGTDCRSSSRLRAVTVTVTSSANSGSPPSARSSAAC